MSLAFDANEKLFCMKCQTLFLEKKTIKKTYNKITMSVDPWWKNAYSNILKISP